MVSVTSSLRGNDPVERFLHRLDKFEPLDPDARNALRRAVQRGSLVSADQELPIETNPDVAIVLSGWICQFRLLNNGRRQITSIMVPGDFVDFGFLTGRRSYTQCVATAPSQMGRIPIRQFTDLTEQYPAILRAALHASAIDAAISRERVISLGLLSALERVSHLLCEFFYRLAAVGLVMSENSYDLPMTQAELGAALGLSTVHVNRTIQTLRKRSVITMHGGRVWIHDLRQLAGLAGFDPGYLNGAMPQGEHLMS